MVWEELAKHRLLSDSLSNTQKGTPRSWRHHPLADLSTCRFHYIFLVDAENPVTATRSYRRIANNHRGEELSQDGPMDKVMKIARLTDEWLLIVDNSNADHLRRIVPDVNRGNIIYTSRLHDLGIDLPPEAVAVVDDMTVDDAVTLLLKAAQMDSTSPHKS